MAEFFNLSNDKKKNNVKRTGKIHTFVRKAKVLGRKMHTVKKVIVISVPSREVTKQTLSDRI
jgi:hypothetical protein